MVKCDVGHSFILKNKYKSNKIYIYILVLKIMKTFILVPLCIIRKMLICKLGQTNRHIIMCKKTKSPEMVKCGISHFISI